LRKYLSIDLERVLLTQRIWRVLDIEKEESLAKFTWRGDSNQIPSEMGFRFFGGKKKRTRLATSFPSQG
jgi:hypothetical protein